MAPTITILTVTLNAAPVITRLMESLRAQSDRRFDFIVMDGASTDDTWNLVQQSADIVTHASSAPDAGVYDALNKGIRLARSDFYLVMGADDVLHPDAVRNFKSTAASTGADVVVADVAAGGIVRRGYHPGRAWLGHAAMITSHSVGMLIRTSLHERFGYYPLRYPMLADGWVIKTLCGNPAVKTVAGNFVAGEFATGGMSNRNFLRALCESWQIQVDTGESRALQYALFQMRLLRHLPRILRR